MLHAFFFSLSLFLFLEFFFLSLRGRGAVSGGEREGWGAGSGEEGALASSSLLLSSLELSDKKVYEPSQNVSP